MAAETGTHRRGGGGPLLGGSEPGRGVTEQHMAAAAEHEHGTKPGPLHYRPRAASLVGQGLDGPQLWQQLAVVPAWQRLGGKQWGSCCWVGQLLWKLLLWWGDKSCRHLWRWQHRLQLWR